MVSVEISKIAQLMSLSFLNCDGDCIEINKISITFMVLF